MGSVIAGARSFEIKIGNETKQGTFQQKAAGTDIDRVARGNEIAEIGREYKDGDYGAVNTASLKRQLSDLMVLDYICGNADRHLSNMLYLTGRTRNEKVVITGIKGIDNDMSFGKKATIENSRMVNPEDMRIMRRTTAHRVLDLTPDKLDLMLSDMDFTKAEKEACHSRLKKLQDKLKADMEVQRKTKTTKTAEGRILVVPDELFKEYHVSSLGASGEGKGGENYFDNIKKLPRMLNRDLIQREKYVKEEDTIRYVDATATGGSMNFVREDVRTDLDMEAVSDRLNIMKQNFEKLGSKWFTKDTGHFQWMQKSLKQLTDKFTELNMKRQAKGAYALEKSDVIKLEALFRQIRMASTNYADTHKNPITSSGKARRDIAREMMDLRVVYRRSPVFDIKKAEVRAAGVKNTSISSLLKEEGASDKNTKVQDTAAKKRPARSRSVSPDDRKNMSL